MFLRIALDVPLVGLFDYAATQTVQVGQRVIVPFGRRRMVGVVMEVTEHSEINANKIKTVEHILADSEPLSAELLHLLRFCSDYYRYPIGQTVMTALPTRMRSDKPIHSLLTKMYQLTGDTPDLPKRKVVQRRILEHLSTHPASLDTLKPLAANIKTPLQELIEQGYVYEYEAPLAPEPVQHTFNNAHTLNQEQQHAVERITACQSYQSFLLHGITGSGKTEVYVHLMHQYLQRGLQVLLMVPEINLTPQLEGYFRHRFPDIALTSLHSGLAEGERMHNWQLAQAGVARIVLGTRLSVFAELPKLGLIIVDEAHDSSYKQQDGLRYSARDVAVFRAHQRGIPIVLGSATPSLENYLYAQTGRYQLIRLTQRAQAAAQLPNIICVNTNHTTMHQGVSENLLRAIEARLARQEQSLLFINQRGFSPVMMCASCGWLSGCKHCAGKMVLHLSEQRLRCHHCGEHMRVPPSCPDCGSMDLHPVGSGTQRIETVLQQRFPKARVLRVDRDSTRRKQAWHEMREQIHTNQVDIIIGTQMLAKGHDFPALTLVGVLNPDGALYSSDFRAAEKLYAQLVQVAGRAGRADKLGEVLIQTEFPDHPLYRSLQQHDFDGWANSQLSERRMAGFPPFMFQAMLRAEGKDEKAVQHYLTQARQLALSLKTDDSLEIFGIVPSAIARRADHIRAQLLIQANSRAGLQRFLREWQHALTQIQTQQLRIALDIDPTEF